MGRTLLLFLALWTGYSKIDHEGRITHHGIEDMEEVYRFMNQRCTDLGRPHYLLSIPLRLPRRLRLDGRVAVDGFSSRGAATQQCIQAIEESKAGFVSDFGCIRQLLFP